MIVVGYIYLAGLYILAIREILKTQPATQFAVENNHKTDFREIPFEVVGYISLASNNHCDV